MWKIDIEDMMLVRLEFIYIPILGKKKDKSYFFSP